MKKLLLCATIAMAICFSSCESFDDSDIWDKFGEIEESIRDHEKRISALEELCEQMNTNIEALQTLVAALEKRDYITHVSEVRKNGEVIGYTISFAHSDTITIYHGQNGKDGQDGANGKDGYIPQIGVMEDTDGIYYWTLDGEWLLDAKGNKIKAVGTDGKDGQDGTNGTDGKDGKDGADGVTPQLKIENDYWYISYDNGATWVELGKATGEDGKDGDDGKDGESLIESITINENSVTFTLANGQVITIPLGNNKEGNKIYYTTNDGKKLFPQSTEPARFGAFLISNTYENGQGVLTFDDTITSIGEGVFSDCSSLASITIPNSVTEIGGYAFEDCSSLASVTIPDSVTEIGEGVFEGCSSLVSVNIPDGVTEIGWSALCGCSSLVSVNIPNSVTEIGEDAFFGCSSLASVTIPDGVTSIGGWAFSGCSSLASVTIPDSVTKIGEGAFSGCSSLESINIPDSVTKIGEEAFYECTGELIINNQTLIGEDYTTSSYPANSWIYGNKFTKLTIGNSVTSIGKYAFYRCSNLTGVTIPDGVTSIGLHAFLSCSNLTSVYCKPTTPPVAEYYMFSSNNSDFTIYVPHNSVDAYKSAEYWSNYKSYIIGHDF